MAVTVEPASVDAAQRVHARIPEFDEGRLDDKYADKAVDDRDPLVLVADREGTAAGYLVAYDRHGDGSYYVWMAGVVPDHRREGVMTALFRRTEDVAADRGYDAVTCKTRNARRGMRQFLVVHGYDVCEFEPVGDLPRHEILHVKAVQEDEGNI